MRKRAIPATLAILGWVFFSLSAAAGTAIDASTAKADQDGETLWRDIRQLGLEGQGWSEVKAPYDRLPAKSEKVVRSAVWGLSRDSAGMAVRFVTDATTIQARWTLTKSRLEMDHMAATGVSGLDFYVKSEDGQWRWLNVGRPKSQSNVQKLASGIPEGKREYLLYLPLYNGVSSVEIGIPKSNALEKAPPYPAARSKPILFYGTSITHGACASRPGMPHPSILGRRFQRPVINLGFSGNGKMDPELGVLFGELDPAVYVIDCLPNMNAKEVAERTEPFVWALRKARPDTPILLVEDRTYSDAFLVKSKRERNLTSRVEFQKAFERLEKAGVNNLHYLKGDHLLGDDNEGTVDSSHPNDLGFMRQADAFAEVLAPLLK